MPLDRRRELLDIIREQDLLVLEDDVHRHLWIDQPPPPPLHALNPTDHVIYTNGYSKCLLPGARIGYLVPPTRLHADLAAAHQTLDITATELNQRALAAYFEQDHFANHLAGLRREHRQRRQAMLDALSRYMPEGCRWLIPHGGLFIWVQLPGDGPSATTLYVHALELGVAFAPGHLFYSVSKAATPGGNSQAAADRGAHHLRLNFVLHPPEAIDDGIRRLALAWERAVGMG